MPAGWREHGRAGERRISAIGAAIETSEDPEALKKLSPFALHKRAKRLMAARRNFDEPFGRALERFHRMKTWKLIGYDTWEEYCRDRLGMSVRCVRERIWLERQMQGFPEIREALISGKLSFSKALLVARSATFANVREKIEEATKTTHQQTDRESTKEEKAKHKEQGIRHIWGTKEAAETFAMAISAAQAVSASKGRRITAGAAVAEIARHFREVWEEVANRPKETKKREKARHRNHGCCAWPGCKRPADHLHHLVFKSRGGSDEISNLVPLCFMHHQHGIHREYLIIEGRAGERLVFKAVGPEGEVTTLWEIVGDDDARRAS